MSGSIPLGKKEDSRLEFKGADALKDPEKIAREVVAMLNAEGGEVWVGLREDGGRAVAVEPVSDPEREERRLLDFLVDTIEPSLSDQEIRVRSVDEGEGTVLRITAAPEKNRQPYAFLKRGGRHFVIRVGDRIRPMMRDEILSRGVARSDFEEDLARAEARVFKERKVVLESKEERFWLRLEPVASLSLDIRDPKYVGLLQDPKKSGNRTVGWSFANFWHRPRVEQDKLSTHPHESRTVDIRLDGGLVFSAPLRSLQWKGEQAQIWPLILLEYVVSAFRIAREVYSDLSPHDRVIADLALVGLKGWSLPLGSPDPWGPSEDRKAWTETDDFLLVQPLSFLFRELYANPDGCAYRLIELVYEAFGFRREDIPDFFDPQSGRLVLPE